MKILRARVIEGSLSIPEALRAQNPGMTETNYLPFTISLAMQMSRPPLS